MRREGEINIDRDGPALFVLAAEWENTHSLLGDKAISQYHRVRDRRTRDSRSKDKELMRVIVMDRRTGDSF